MMDYLYKLDADAEIAWYKNYADFRQKTSQYAHGRKTPWLEGTPIVYTRMSQAMIRACPHVIFTPDHYRADGTCKCDDPHDSNMEEWGYTWDEREKVWA